jgi:hypothetical protein
VAESKGARRGWAAKGRRCRLVAGDSVGPHTIVTHESTSTNWREPPALGWCGALCRLCCGQIWPMMPHVAHDDDGFAHPACAGRPDVYRSWRRMHSRG